MRPEPAELLFIGHRALEFTESSHHFLDITADELACVKLRRAANKVISLAKSEGQTGPD
jgi:hypothetical protein